MAFFDPVDLSTESLLWPGRLGFCLSERLGCVKFSDRVGGWVAPWAPGLIWVRDRRAGRSVA